LKDFQKTKRKNWNKVIKEHVIFHSHLHIILFSFLMFFYFLCKLVKESNPVFLNPVSLLISLAVCPSGDFEFDLDLPFPRLGGELLCLFIFSTKKFLFVFCANLLAMSLGNLFSIRADWILGATYFGKLPLTLNDLGYNEYLFHVIKNTKAFHLFV